MVGVYSRELGRSLPAGTRCESIPCAPGLGLSLLGRRSEANATHLVRPWARPLIVTNWPNIGKFQKATIAQAIALDHGLVAHPAAAPLGDEGWNEYHLAM